MTRLADLPNELTHIDDDGWLYTFSDNVDPENPHCKMKQSTLRGVDRVETLTNKTIGTVAVKVPVFASQLQMTGSAKLTAWFRTAGNLTIPAITNGAEGDATYTVTGAAVGDHVVFNPTAAPPAGLAIMSTWVSGANTVTVRIRNHSGSNYGGGTLASVALVTRSAAADV